MFIIWMDGFNFMSYIIIVIQFNATIYVAIDLLLGIHTWQINGNGVTIEINLYGCG